MSADPGMIERVILSRLPFSSRQMWKPRLSVSRPVSHESVTPHSSWVASNETSVTAVACAGFMDTAPIAHTWLDPSVWLMVVVAVPPSTL